jgi:hypothetical protein
VAGRPLRWRAASMARCRTASGLRAGMPSPWRVKALRSDGQVVPQLGGGRVDAAQPQAEQALQVADLEFLEPEVGFEPTTFRLRVGP